MDAGGPAENFSRMMKTADAPRDPRRSLGNAGEQLAEQALVAAGYSIIERNWRCPAGEIDLVVQEYAPDFVTGQAAVPWLVLVEVRTRRGDRYGSARQSITSRKQHKLREVAAHYVQQQAWSGPWRIDVIAIQMDAQGHLLTIEHIRHAVTAD
jgi:putative endonuclease